MVMLPILIYGFNPRGIKIRAALRMSKLILKFIEKCAAAAKSLQSCLTLCNPTDDSPPGSPSLGFSR